MNVVATVLSMALAASLTAIARPAGAQSLTLSPAVVELTGEEGKSTSQILTLENSTSLDLEFRLVAKDVVVKNGTRLFSDAGAVPNGIAATAAFSEPTVWIPSKQTRSVRVTLTLPRGTSRRAVVVLFEGVTKIAGPVGRSTASIGTLFTFSVSDSISIDAGALVTRRQTAAANASFSQTLRNDGTEPAVPAGSLALLDARGRFIGRASFGQRRLLPGERAEFAAEFPGELRAGAYQVVSTFEYRGHTWSRTSELVIP